MTKYLSSFALCLSLAATTAAASETAPDQDGRQFVWPVHGWIDATGRYPSGSVHPGAADIYSHVWQPIRAARAGKVVFAGLMYQPYPIAYSVVLSHGNGYQTMYGHMANVEPVVSVGDTVTAGQVIGYLGSTGRGNSQHMHFGILKNCPSTTQVCCEPIGGMTCPASSSVRGTTVFIPGLRLGSWVTAGTPVNGGYTPLSRITAQSAPYRIRTFDAVPLLSGASGSASVLTTVPTGTTLTARTSSGGFLNVDYNGRSGWISQGATRADASGVDGFATLIRLKTLGTSASTHKVYASTSTASSVLGTIRGNFYVLGFSSKTDANGAVWYRIMVNAVNPQDGNRRNVKLYGWVQRNVAVATTSAFATGVMTPTTARLGPGPSFAAARTLASDTSLVISDVQNGWYRYRNASANRYEWIGGWDTFVEDASCSISGASCFSQ